MNQNLLELSIKKTQIKKNSDQETQIKKNQKVIRNGNDQLVVKIYPKTKQLIIQHQKFKVPNYHSCKRNNWLEFDKGYYSKNCEFIISKQKHQIDKKVLRQEGDFPTRLNYANKKTREIYYSKVNSTYNTTQDMISKLQELKGKTKLKFYKNISNHEENIDIRISEEPFSENSPGISKIYHEVLLLMKYLQTKPQGKDKILLILICFILLLKTELKKKL